MSPGYDHHESGARPPRVQVVTTTGPGRDRRGSRSRPGRDHHKIKFYAALTPLGRSAARLVWPGLVAGRVALRPVSFGPAWWPAGSWPLRPGPGFVLRGLVADAVARDAPARSLVASRWSGLCWPPARLSRSGLARRSPGGSLGGRIPPFPPPAPPCLFPRLVGLWSCLRLGVFLGCAGGGGASVCFAALGGACFAPAVLLRWLRARPRSRVRGRTLGPPFARESISYGALTRLCVRPPACFPLRP